MSWIADPRNELIVDSTDQQPQWRGWIVYTIPLTSSPMLLSSNGLFLSPANAKLTTSSSLKANKGLRVGAINTMGTKRLGNNNDTLTLRHLESIMSHAPDVDGIFPNSFPVMPNKPYTLGVTALGSNKSEKQSITTLKILWLTSGGMPISYSVQGIRSNTGQKVRNYVIGYAPENAAGAVILYSATNTAVLSYPTFNAGNDDIRKGKPTFEGDNWIADIDNLMTVDPLTGGTALMDGWTNEFGNKITPTNGVITVAANTEARLYFIEDQASPQTLGIPILGSQQYTLGITELPSRTASTVVYKIYDSTGTRLLQTVATSSSGNRIKATFTAHPEAAWCAIKIVAGVSSTSFGYPTLTYGPADPGQQPPVFLGTLSKNWIIPTDVRNRVMNQTEMVSDVLGNLVISTVFLGDNLSTISMTPKQLLADNLNKVSLTTDFASDNRSLVRKELELFSNNQAQFSKTAQLLSDNCSTIHNTKVFLSSNNATVSFTKTLTSDVLATFLKLYSFKTDNNQRIARSFVFATDNRSKVSLTKTLPSDTRKTVSRTTQLLTDNTQRISNVWVFKSTLNGKKILMPINYIRYP